MWVGLTGGIATGKSQVAELLRTKGYAVIDADRISKNLTKKNAVGYQKIVLEFGPEVLDHHKEIDRIKLANIVFNHPAKLKQLENILHPLIQNEVLLQKEALEKQGHAIIFYDIPLLFEKNLRSQFDLVVVVSCTEKQQVQRLCQRNGISEDEASKRIRIQLPLKEKIAQADVVIDNSGNLDKLRLEIDVFLHGLLVNKL